MPACYRNRLTYWTIGSLTSGVLKHSMALSEFLNKLPMYSTQMYGIYKYARVLAVEVEIVVLNTGTDDIKVSLGRVPLSDVSGITFTLFSEMADTRTTFVSAKGGVDKATVRKNFIARDALGNALSDRSYWVNSTQAVSGTPLHSDDYCALLFVDGASSGSTAKIDIKTHYHLEWFDMQYAV